MHQCHRHYIKNRRRWTVTLCDGMKAAWKFFPLREHFKGSSTITADAATAPLSPPLDYFFFELIWDIYTTYSEKEGVNRYEIDGARGAYFFDRDEWSLFLSNWHRALIIPACPCHVTIHYHHRQPSSFDLFLSSMLLSYNFSWMFRPKKIINIFPWKNLPNFNLHDMRNNNK